MRGMGPGGRAAALIVGLAVAIGSTRADERHGKAAGGGGLLSDLFNERPQTPIQMAPNGVQAKPQTLRSPTTADSLLPADTAETVDTITAKQERCKNALIRRMAVCDRLRDIADKTGNDALWEQANQLEERAQAIYWRQTSRMPQPAPTPLSAGVADAVPQPRP